MPSGSLLGVVRSSFLHKPILRSPVAPGIHVNVLDAVVVSDWQVVRIVKQSRLVTQFISGVPPAEINSTYVALSLSSIVAEPLVDIIVKMKRVRKTRQLLCRWDGPFGMHTHLAGEPSCA